MLRSPVQPIDHASVCCSTAAGEPVEVRLTSEVVIFQMTGRRRVKHPGLQSLHDEAVRITTTFLHKDLDRGHRPRLPASPRGAWYRPARRPASRGPSPAASRSHPAVVRSPAGHRATKEGPEAAGPQQLGAMRSAQLLSELTGLSVRASDVEELAAAGLASIVGHYKKRPLYDVAALRALAADERHRAGARRHDPQRALTVLPTASRHPKETKYPPIWRWSDPDVG